MALLPEGRLAVIQRKFDPRPLDMVSLDTFTGSGLFAGYQIADTVTFTRTASGDVTGFTMSTGRVRRLAFTRVDVPAL
jgi:hypothetical protein